MRVLFALNAGEGGATISACELMAGLRKRGHECFAIHPRCATPEGSARIAAAASASEEVYLTWWNRNYRAKRWKRPLLVLRDALESGAYAGTIARIAALIRRWDIDVVHTNTAVTLEPPLAAQLARAKHVWHIREPAGMGALYRFWLPDAALARTFNALSDAVIVNSKSTGDLFDRTGTNRKVAVVYNGIDVARFSSTAARERGRALRKQWGLGEDTVLVAMVASLATRWKKHALFVRAAALAAARDANARFAIIGHDPDAAGGYAAETEYAREVKDEARALGLGERMRFTGYVDDVPAIMNAIDLLVHPCETESFGRIGVEAMAAGRAVVSVRGGGLAELVDEAVTGLLTPPDEAAPLAEATLSLIRDGARRRAMGEAGRARADLCFSLEQTVGAVDQIYRSL